MELTLDDCLAIAGRECATEHELRAAVCVAVGQALHYRYEARGYSDAAEVAKRDADRARAEARAYSEALIAKDSAPDTSDGLDYPARAEVWKLRESVDALRARAERAEAERDESMAAHDYTRAQWAAACRERDAAREALATAGKVTAQAVREREALSLRLSAAERERDEARAALDISRESAREAREEIAQSLALVDEARAELDAALARPTYEARATAPTRQELRLHREQHGGWWIVTRAGDRPTVLRLGADDADDAGASPATPRTWVPLDASGLPCAWPVVP